jgi:hypothetical protein
MRLGKEGPEARRGGATASDGRPAGGGKKHGSGEGKKKLTCGPWVSERRERGERGC